MLYCPYPTNINLYHPPNLSVTIDYSDRIPYLVLRGIKSKEMKESIPFKL